jgi:DNA-binding NarL/FixJ family response regulator
VTVDEQPLRILIVDADAYFRRGIREILNEADGIRVVGEAGDADEAVHLTTQLCPHGLDLVLMDTALPHQDGIATVEKLTATHPALPVVMLTLSTQDRDVFESLRVGAVGYLTKNLTPDALVRALHGFQRGECLPISRAIGERLLTALRQRATQRQAASPQPPPPNLTAREREVFELIARGARDREIAQQLVISQSTVKKHVQNMLRKLNVRNRAQAIALLRRA